MSPELRKMFSGTPNIALVLGSGLSPLAECLERPRRVPFHEVPGLEATTIPGHAGCLTLGTWARKHVLVFEGRLHFYEGHAWRTVLAPVHVAHGLGVPILFATNAAGGIRADLAPGQLMAITAHIDGARPHFWRQPAPPSPYSKRLVDLLQKAGRRLGFDVPTGTYAQVTGPCYETPSEIRALQKLGADAVGMSTGREVQAAFDLGLECAGLSCITNRAAGLADGSINHEEVLRVATQQRDRLGRLLETFLELV